MSMPEHLKPEGEPTPVEETGPDNRATIKNILRELFNENPDFAFKVGNSTYRRPPNTSRTSNFSYYRKIFALEVKLVVDKMIEDKQDREWKYAAFPNYSHSTVYQRVYQGMRYLCDELDFDGRYGEFRQMVVLTKEKTGIRLSFIREKLEGKAFDADVITDEDRIADWEKQVNEFLEDSTRQTLHLKKLNLSHEQVTLLTSSFEGLEGINAIVTDREIKIVKDNSLVTPVEPKKE